jgi:hypothetical protein
MRKYSNTIQLRKFLEENDTDMMFIFAFSAMEKYAKLLSEEGAAEDVTAGTNGFINGEALVECAKVFTEFAKFEPKPKKVRKAKVIETVSQYEARIQAGLNGLARF